MPVPHRTHRAEAKYNVTTDFPHLGLHSAAATGNVGLVKYALTHGQPINSVLDGVLPLHAACSGGNDLVVKLLIENGADVNAPRLPRRYSNDKNRDASAPIVGTSGSTPLHFAAANGHTSVIHILLLHGAHPNRPDKHGVTPESLARQKGWRETADLIRDWYLNKDKDLMERGEAPWEHGMMRERQSSLGSDIAEGSMRTRLRVKHSIDNALHMLKPSYHNLCDANPKSSAPPPPPPSIGIVAADSPPHDNNGYTFYPTSDHDEELPPRRPSLPHIYEDAPRKLSTSSPNPRRPRSAGNGADPKPPPRNRKISSKYSLLNLFKKAGADSSIDATSGSTSLSPSPHALSSPKTAPADLSSSSADSPSLSRRSRSRLASNDSQLPPDLPSFDGNALRDRSLSGGSRPTDDDAAPETPVRPGILRAHQRSSSSGQSQSAIQAQSMRTLRFDSSSSSILKGRNGSNNSRRRAFSGSPSRALHGSGSAGSLKRRAGRPSSAGSGSGRGGTAIPDSAPPATANFEVELLDEDEEEYGRPIHRYDDVEPKSRLTELRTEGRSRGESFTSSSSSLSPITDATSASKDFPFSINRPPPTEDPQHLAVPYVHRSPSLENRMRGDSVSSASTDGSDNPQLSPSGTTASNASGGVTTPALPCIVLPDSKHQDTSPNSPPGITREDGLIPSPDGGLNERRAHVPLDIDIRSISSHAQAEELVQRAQQSILDMELALDVDDESGAQRGSVGLGRTPLSAKLAAYGESLALERRLKREAELKGGGGVRREAERVDRHDTGSGRGVRRRVVGRQRSLEQRSDTVRATSRVRQPKRPSTSSGTTTGSDHPSSSPRSSGDIRIHHQATRSTPDVLADAALRVPKSQHSQTQSETLPPLLLYRSRTPDPGLDKVRLDNNNDLPGMPLSRVSTAPLQDSYNDLLPQRGRGIHDRHIARATKLTRMGFSASNNANGQQQQAHTISDASRYGHPGSKSRFGIKSLMQSFKGKA